MEILREKDLCQKLKVSPNTARKIRREHPDFPKRVVLVGDATGWLSDEVEEWLRKRPRYAADCREGEAA